MLLHFTFQPVKSKAELFPYLLVTIGSGVSIIKVDSETSWERIGGTATGGGTFWGLGRFFRTFLVSFQPHLYKGNSDLKQNGTQEKAFYTLSHGVGPFSSQCQLAAAPT